MKVYAAASNFGLSIGCMVLGLCLAARAVYAVDEHSLRQRYFAELVPFVQKEVKSTFSGKGGVPIAYRMFRHVGAKGGIVIVHGYSESTLKNAELIHDLIMANYNVYSLDLRGMGESGRLLANPQIGHVAAFSDYVDDLRSFVTTVVKPVEPGDLFLIGHSTGGLASALLLEQPGDLFQAVAWSAPMFGIQSRGVPYWLAYAGIWTAIKLGLAEHYVLGLGDYDAKEDRPEQSHVTHSLLRAQFASELYKQLPQLRIWGTSYGWVYNALIFSQQAVDHAADVKTPILLLQAEADVVVSSAPQQIFCERAKNCRLIVATGAMHEILNESDPIRNLALRQMLDFFAAHASATTVTVKQP